MSGLWRGLALLAALAGAGLAQAEGEPAAARVNGVEISDWRLQRYFAEFLQARGRNPAAIRSPTLYGRLRDEALQQLIDRELLWQEAQRQGVTIDAAALDAAIAARRQAFAAPALFDARLADAGFDADSYRAYLRQEMAAQQVYAALSQAPAPSEEEVRRFFEAQRERLQRPESLRARHILLAAGNAEDERRARALARRLRGGENFAELARRYSRDTTAGAGGDLGYFPRGTMVPEFEAVAFAVAPGELAGPVHSRYGWHLILVEERRAAQPPDETRALPLVRAWLQRERAAEAGQAGLRRLRAQARIEWAGRGPVPGSGETPGQRAGSSPPIVGNVAGEGQGNQ
ncbi:peptidylprolyl isomerase [Pseudomonas citronellolis]|uniref:peptidylprolyl isomerase n=1 Tax=Pseudomonas citronellolis TaxID=53408 RepID=UPI0023E3BAB7|nr:peptidylprolyl isomerase [Pseudomonas citronellolis]MDF3935214.1 peptidylprolyl isomerase [Pseudomonas citronellolis]